MSSATLLFILHDILADSSHADGQTLGALAFGPGLTVEAARMVVRDPAVETREVPENAAMSAMEDRRPTLVDL
jgi:hypothetical protein